MNWLNIFLKTSADAATSVVEEASEAASNGTASSSLLSSLAMPIMLVAFGLIFYFLMIRPEKKRKKKVEEERNNMKVGDTVVSIGGITGEIEEIKGETVTIFTGDGSIDLQKWAIRSIIDASEDEEA